MEQIKQWAVNICITLIVTGVFSMLIPQGNMEKVMRFAVSTFFLCCLLLPFFTGLPELEWEWEIETYSAAADPLESTVKEQLQALSERNVERVVREMLENAGITAEKIEADIHISEENSVSISRVTVVLKESAGKSVTEIAGWIKQQTGLDADVTILRDTEKDGEADGDQAG